MTKHTAGPWKYDPNSDAVWDTGRPQYDVRICDSARGDKELPDEEITANMRLIAAAPQLLEAATSALNILQRLRDEQPSHHLFQTFGAGWETCGSLAVAIDAAEGEQPLGFGTLPKATHRLFWIAVNPSGTGYVDVVANDREHATEIGQELMDVDFLAPGERYSASDSRVVGGVASMSGEAVGCEPGNIGTVWTVVTVEDIS